MLRSASLRSHQTHYSFMRVSRDFSLLNKLSCLLPSDTVAQKVGEMPQVGYWPLEIMMCRVCLLSWPPGSNRTTLFAANESCMFLRNSFRNLGDFVKERRRHVSQGSSALPVPRETQVVTRSFYIRHQLLRLSIDYDRTYLPLPP